MYLTYREQLKIMLVARSMIRNPKFFLKEREVHARGRFGRRRRVDSRLAFRFSAIGALIRAFHENGTRVQLGYWWYSNQQSLRYAFERANAIGMDQMDEWCAEHRHPEVLIGFDRVIASLLANVVSPPHWELDWYLAQHGYGNPYRHTGIKPPPTATSTLAFRQA